MIRLLVSILTFFLVACSQGVDTAEGPPDTVQYLFVQSAKGGSIVRSDDDPNVYLLTLTGVEAATTFFSDRPYRLAGYVGTAEFAEYWKDTADDSFLKDPPNAALQIADAQSGTDVFIVELLDVQYSAANGVIKYRVRSVARAQDSVELFHHRGDEIDELPTEHAFGPASLFIDSWYSDAWHLIQKDVNVAADAVREVVRNAEQTIAKAVVDFENALKEAHNRLEQLALYPAQFVELELRELHKLVAVVLPQGVGACLNIVPGLQEMTDVVSSDAATPQSSWMTMLADTIGGRELGDLAMPASHDAGTYPINGLSLFTGEEVTHEYAHVLNAVKTLYPGTFPVFSYVAKWSRAQRHSVSAQLAAGVRLFDFRFIPIGTGFYTPHEFSGAELDTILTDVKLFLQAHPQEIVIMNVGKLYSRERVSGEMTEDDAEKVAARIFAAIGGSLVTTDSTADTPGNMRVAELWSKRQQVVAAFQGEVHARLSAATQRYVWNSEDVINSPWTNKQSWNATQPELEKNLREKIKPSAPNKLGVLQGQMTPDGSLIGKRVVLDVATGTARKQLECLEQAAGIPPTLIADIFDHIGKLTRIDVALSLQDEAARENPQLTDWVIQNKPRHAVMANYIADYPQLISAIIDTNR